jgi:tyrosine-protein kinase Etk/Wzc
MSADSGQNVAASHDDEIDLKKLWGHLQDGKQLIVGLACVTTMLALLYAFAATPIYKADVLVQVEEKASGSSALLGDAMGAMLESPSSAATEIEIIQSRMVLGQVVDALNLTTIVAPDYGLPVFGKSLKRLSGTVLQAQVARFEPPKTSALHEAWTLEIIEPNAYQLLDADGQVLFKAKVGEAVQHAGYRMLVTQLQGQAGDRFGLRKQSRLQAILNLKSALNVSEQGKKTGILSLSLQGEQPQRIESTLDSVAKHYYQQNLSRHSAESEKSLAFLQEHLPLIEKQLYDSEEALNQYRQSHDSVDLSLSMEASSSLSALVDVEKQLNALNLQEREVSQKFTRDHPVYTSLLEKRQVLLSEKQKLESLMHDLPETQREILRLQRNVQVNQQIYVQLSNKVQELSVVRAGTVGNVRLLDAAQTYEKAVKPKKALIVVLGALLGLIAGVGLVLVRAALHQGIQSPEEVEALGLPVYTALPVSAWQHARDLNAKQQSDGILALTQPADLAVESLRSLRTSLHFAMLDAPNKTLMICGASPGIGKSFVASNFAAVSAALDQKVLLIDADLRRGQLHQKWDLPNNQGLSALLSCQCQPEQVVQTTACSGLDFISRGQAAPNPSELLMRQELCDLLAWANEHYDLVIVDTPPVLAVTDAVIIGAQAGTTLMVGRFEQNTLKEIEATRNRLAMSGIKTNGFIMNAVEQRASAAGYYYQYSYESVA